MGFGVSQLRSLAPFTSRCLSAIIYLRFNILPEVLPPEATLFGLAGFKYATPGRPGQGGTGAGVGEQVRSLAAWRSDKSGEVNRELSAM